MKKIQYLFILLALGAGCVSCSDFLDPETDNTRDEGLLDEAAYFCGPLNDVYSDLPTLFDVKMDVMTDNAVKGDLIGDYYRCGIGAMSPALNPLNIWEQGYRNIRKLNIFLSRMVLDESTSYKTPVRFFALTTEADYEDNLNMFWRLKGEAYVLRAYWLSELLRNFGGEAADGRMLGVPLVGDKIVSVEEDLNLPRASYDDCVQAVIDDCDCAVNECRLPDLYGKPDATSRVYGKTIRDHVSGAAAKAIKARTLLYAASPAYNKSGDPDKWETAAIAAAEAVKAAGGINAAFASRDDYYFNQIANVDNPNYDVIMRGQVLKGNSALEADNFPPGMYGSALVNVSQNLVDAFPDSNGYPIAESGLYKAETPYADRDPRLNMFVGYNSGKIGTYTLEIFEGGWDAYNPLKKTSRSGYYLKKTLKQSIVLTPGQQTSTTRANILIGLPEVLLNFAEAANEAWGVTGDPKGYGFHAKQALRRILTRANANGAKYLDEVILEDQSHMRNYLRNERRLELCFEGHYYYDLRRWYAADPNWQDKLNTTVRGTRITRGDSGLHFEEVTLEKRIFESPYQPIPYTEVFNAPTVVQNRGWK